MIMHIHSDKLDMSDWTASVDYNHWRINKVFEPPFNTLLQLFKIKLENKTN